MIHFLLSLRLHGKIWSASDLEKTSNIDIGLNNEHIKVILALVPPFGMGSSC